MKLKPCPFCGEDDIRLSTVESDGYKAIDVNFYVCYNDKCGARVFQSDQSKEGAIKAWNRREGCIDPYQGFHDVDEFYKD